MADEDFPERMIMDVNIREFGHTISLICALEVGGKITPAQDRTKEYIRGEFS